MNSCKLLFLSFFIYIGFQNASAQTVLIIDKMEEQHKECLKIKSDSTACSKVFLTQMDSMLNVVLEKVKTQLFSDEKSALIQEQSAWSKKKGEFFKKQDETFVYNLQEGIWKKDMIRITYQQKADFLLKRIKVLLKRLKE